MSNSSLTRVMAGIPAVNRTLYHRLRFLVGDPAACIDFADGRSTLILRDIEMQRARQHARVDQVACPRDYEPAEGLSGDRETATAQAVAECLRREGVQQVSADRTLPLLFAHEMQKAGIVVECDPHRGVLERRGKDAEEVERLREAQQVTEGAMRMACEMAAAAEVRGDGVLLRDGQPLTSERLRAEIDVWLMRKGYSNPASIVASGPDGADCHNLGAGELRTGQPIIVDIFPCNRQTLYNGDCTRTVVHGEIPEALAKMHAAVCAAKAAACDACRAGVTGEDVHQATRRVILERGYAMGLPPADADPSYCAMTHGTGHGIGLDVHEPPLLDIGGPELIVGQCIGREQRKRLINHDM